MIEIGISGCDNLRAAELVRVLINHPDVELKWVTNSSNEAVRLDHIVPGVIVSWLAETTGVILSFFLMRTILRDSAEKLIQKSPYFRKPLRACGYKRKAASPAQRKGLSNR